MIIKIFTFRILIHVVNGDSVDPVGDFVTINQELALFHPKMMEKKQIVVINKIDIPSVRDKLEMLTKSLREQAQHTRVLGISATTGENVKVTMLKTHKMLSSLPPIHPHVSNMIDEEFVNLDDKVSSKFDVVIDEASPHQFTVVGSEIEKVN